MTDRDNLRAKVVHRLGKEFSDVRLETSEYTIEAVYSGTVDGNPVTIEVTRYPGGENPESYGGEDRWSVRVLGDEGREIRRPTNPAASLSEALEDIDWGQVRYDL